MNVNSSPDPIVRRMLVLGAICASLILLWKVTPIFEDLIAPQEAPARTITARGDLAADEKNTIELFEKSRDSVVAITPVSPTVP